MALQERELVSGMAVFVAIVDAGSLSAAARSCGLTPSAVSKLVTRLETNFGAPLLRRTTRRMTVTDAGQSFYQRAQLVLEDLRNLEQEMSSKSHEPRGLVRVSASQLLGQVRVAPLLHTVMKQMPAVSLELELTDRVVDLVAERIDLAVRITAEPPPSFVARRVGSVRRVLCASPEYLRQQRAPRSPRELTEHACLALSAPGNVVAWSFRGDHEQSPQRVRLSPRLRVNSSMALYEATRAGLGIADLPRYLVEADLLARRLIAVLEPLELQSSGVFVIYGAGRLLPPRVREIASHLVRELKKTLP
jgi:DNA-binding transcriptional LysR family regulator